MRVVGFIVFVQQGQLRHLKKIHDDVKGAET
jgi:hypothetical protein